MNVSILGLKNDLLQRDKVIGDLVFSFQQSAVRIQDLENEDIEGTLNDIKKKLVAETVKELFTPI